MPRVTRTTLGSILFLLGLCLTLMAVLFIRASNVIIPLLEPDIRQWILFSGDNPFLVSFPNTMMFGLGLLTIGAVLQSLYYSLGSNNVATHPHRPLLFEKSISKSKVSPSLFSVSVIILTAAIFHDGQYWSQNTSLWAPFWFIAWCSLVLLVSRKLYGADAQAAPILSKREICWLLLGTLTLIGFYVMDIESYKFAFIGDEYSFFYFGVQLKETWFKNVAWLSARGPDNWAMPIAVWQTLLMSISTAHNFWWRLSMGLLEALCVVPVYLTCRTIVQDVGRFRWMLPAFGSSCLFLSELIIVWARIGKPHAPFLPPVIFAIYFYIEAQRRNSNFHLFLAGFACGLGVLIGPLGPMIAVGCIVALFLLDTLYSLWKGSFSFQSAMNMSSLLLAGGILGSGPILFQFDYFQHLFTVTMASSEAQNTKHLLFPKTLQTVLLFLSYSANSHFLSGNVVDPITAFLAAQSLGARRLVGSRMWCSAILILMVMGFLVGGLCQYSYPPETRVLLVMFPISLLALIGLTSLANFFSCFNNFTIFLVAALCASYNVTKLEQFDPYKRMVYYFVAELQEIQTQGPAIHHVLILPSNPQSEYKPDWIDNFAEIYRFKDRLHIFRDDENVIANLSLLLTRHDIKIEVRVPRDLPHENEIRDLTNKLGAHWGPYIEDRYLKVIDGWDRVLAKPLLEVMKKIEK